jgi:putative hydrolase of the HAD superfamily
MTARTKLAVFVTFINSPILYKNHQQGDVVVDRRVVFFDLFDTLVAVDRGYLEPYFDRETDRLGDNGTLKDAKMTIERLVDLHPDSEFMQSHSVEEMAKYYEGCMKRSLMNPPEGVLKMLAGLKESGCELCVISDAAFVDVAAWNESPLAKYFDNTAFSCEVGYVKPDPRLFETAKRMMNNPRDCVFIGDGGHDELIGAQNAGMQTVKAEWIKNRRDETLYEYSNYRIQDATQVPKTAMEIDFDVVRMYAEMQKEIDAKIYEIEQISNHIALGFEVPSEKVDEVLTWINNHQCEVQAAIDKDMISLDNITTIASQRYDINQTREIQSEINGFEY